AFFVLYANIDSFDASKYSLEKDKLSVMDKWILSKLNACIKETDNDLENYRITEAAKCLQEFVDDLSNWYVRRCRDRFWAKGMEQDKINAYMTLYTCLVDICRAAAPMVPFMTEEIYQNLVRSINKEAPESIHLTDYPVCDESMIDETLMRDMDEVLDIVVLSRAARNACNIKNRQPIAKMYVKAENELSEFYKDIIADELNVKEVEFSDDVRNFTTYTFKPQLKTVGPKYGKVLGKIREYLSALDGNAAMDELEAKGELRFDADGTKVALSKDDLLIEMTSKEGFVEQSDNKITVVLDTNLTDELIEEGFVRELISKIQNMRKEAGFEVMDKITVYSEGNETLAGYLEGNRDFVLKEVMADSIVSGSTDGFIKEWDINGQKVKLGVKKNA
ncbi:MAG: class I tRNA ligase family protein, partial [Lachnospiraceae bacterium]|nr:class I tRNA ligase family protein [Lachnospiraceae bacterium]